ncbi:hypothetical protein [Methylobacterium hispanicum]|uniref:hypothetical protein n=1 Tax=Methylobacterium hispanicum TaxID=270350 RepID=UPI002F2D2644
MAAGRAGPVSAPAGRPGGPVLAAERPPTLAGHTLVLLRPAGIAVRRDERSGEARATLTLEAVTETP